MNLSPQQERALDSVGRWFRSKSSPIYRVFGYAGVGKSTIAKHFAEGVNGNVLFAAFTGKASLVLRNKGCPNVSTIHSLIYNPRDKSRRRMKELQAEKARLSELSDVDQDQQTELERAIEEEHENLRRPAFDLNENSSLAEADLLVVDECSMVSQHLAKDLMSFGTPILVLGDPAQLPPVKGRGYFTECEPDVMLTEIHRQALDNPIIEMATRVRKGERLPVGEYGSSLVVHRSDFDRDSIPLGAQILVGKNKTRVRANERRREALGFTDPLPQEGDRLVCLRNNHDAGLLNGAIWYVVARLPHNNGVTDTAEYRLRSDDDGRELDVEMHTKPFFGKELEFWERQQAEEFDFGLALTVHKSQGSQYDDVFLVDESKVFRQDAKRWLYTGVTRAVERVTVIR